MTTPIKYEVLIDLKKSNNNSNSNELDFTLTVDNMIRKSIRELLDNLMKIGFTGDFEIFCYNREKKER